MRIAIFGAGYVGLVTGTCFAELGNDVMCCDIDREKIDMLKQGNSPIYEPGLEEVIGRNMKEERLFFTTDPREVIEFGDILFIAVGTPSKEYGQADLSFVFKVAEEIGSHLETDNKIIVLKSTVPVGTNREVEEKIRAMLEARGADYEFAVVSNPEFLKEGEAVEDFIKPDRIVVGTSKQWAKEKMKELYSPLINNGHPLYFVDFETSEMSKYVANAMLAAKISFINQIANMCDIVGADVEGVRKIICADKRIGQHFLNPGPGYGGSCFPKDVQALSVLAKKFGYTAHLIEAIEIVNESQKDIVAKKILKKLIAKGAKVSAYDPVAAREARKVFGNRIEYCQDMYDCLKDADLLAVITEWPQFKEPDFNKVKELLKHPVIIDGRNIYSPERMKKLGFGYLSIGRPAVIQEEALEAAEPVEHR